MLDPLQCDDEFLTDVIATRNDLPGLRVWWLGQSGFLLQWRGRHVLLDPYLSDSLTRKYTATDKPHVRMTGRVVDPARLDFIDVVTSSHNHTDHLDADTIKPLLLANPELAILVPLANRNFVAERLGLATTRLRCVDDATTDTICDIEFTGMAAAHEEVELDTKGHCKYLGYIVRLGEYTVYHSGDTVL